MARASLNDHKGGDFDKLLWQAFIDGKFDTLSANKTNDKCADMVDDNAGNKGVDIGPVETSEEMVDFIKDAAGEG